MMNPWVILGIVLFWIASMAGAAWKGAQWQEGKDAQEKVEALASAIDVANVKAEEDKQLAVKQAQRNTAAQTRAQMIRSQANAAIQSKPQPLVCDWDQPSYSVLVSAVSAANGDKVPERGLLDAVRRSNATSK